MTEAKNGDQCPRCEKSRAPRVYIPVGPLFTVKLPSPAERVQIQRAVKFDDRVNLALLLSVSFFSITHQGLMTSTTKNFPSFVILVSPFFPPITLHLSLFLSRFHNVPSLTPHY